MVKYLIINADDFWMSYIFNEVILDVIEKNLITSTTVMVNRVEDIQKKQLDNLIYLSIHRNLSIWLHLDFINNDTDYISQINQQYKKFIKLFNFSPSHIDIHKPFNFEDSFYYVEDFCINNNLAFRNHWNYIKWIKMTDSEVFFWSISDFNEILYWLDTLEEEKYYEILFHPWIFDKNCKSSLNKDREKDRNYIKKLNAVILRKNIKLVNYFDLKKKY